MRVRISFVLVVGTSLIPCSPTASQTRDSIAERARIIPRVDHHQHVAGPVAITMQALTPSPPAVTLPAPLARLTTLRSQFSGRNPTPTELAQLYANDALALDITDRPWIQWNKGVDEIGPTLGAFSEKSRFVPQYYSIDGKGGYIAGVVRLGESTKDDMYFVWSVREVGDNDWRITSEQITIQPPVPYQTPLTARDIVRHLDDAGIRRGVILSTAFWLGRPQPASLDEQYAKVKAENDWAIAQVAQFPNRLIVFCGVNPLRDYAVAELERCAKNPAVRGMKLQFGNSRVDLRKPDHVEKIRRFFAAANAHRLAIVVHLWTQDPSYGPDHSRIFLEQILPSAPDITIQIAHLAGGGYFGSDPALGVFVDAIKRGDRRMKNVYFDIATDVIGSQSEQTHQRIAARLREIGLERILYGSDTPIPGRDAPVAAWAMVRRLPLTNKELSIIANNVAPYFAPRH